jgi:molecular chaperone GrpE
MSTPPDQTETGRNPNTNGGTDGDASGTVAPDPGSAQDDWDAERARLEDRWRRAVADLDNLRKRYARELESIRSSERSAVADAWLPIVDNLERALEHAGEDSSAVTEGVRSILAQALNVLERLGYSRDTETGVPFDPQRHEVVGVVDDADQPSGTVLEVVRPGYGNGANQLRPASVVVSRREG